MSLLGFRSLLLSKKMSAFLWNVYSYFRVVFCLLQNLYCVPAYMFLMLLLWPLYYISIETYAQIENILFSLLLYVVSSWSYGAGFIVQQQGDDIFQLFQNEKNRVLMVVNHQSTADVPFMMQAFGTRAELYLLWVMHIMFKWTNFGVISQVHGDYFVDPKHYIPGSMLKHCLTKWNSLKDMIIIFPEGGFRYKLTKSSNSFANKKGYPILSNVGYPRVSGFQELLKKEMNFTHVVDLTICYDDAENSPSIMDILRGNNCSQVHFYYVTYTMNEVRADEDWLYELFHRKEALLKNHYAKMKQIKQQKLKESNESWLNSGNGDSLLSNKDDQQDDEEKIVKNENSNNIDENEESESQSTNNQSDADKRNANSSSRPRLKFRTYHDFSSLTFDINQGRPVQLSWPRVLMIHLFYFLVAYSFYQFLHLIISSIF